MVLLEFMFSGVLKFIGCFFILYLIIVLIEGAISNICRTIITVKALKYNKETRSDNTIKNNVKNIMDRK